MFEFDKRSGFTIVELLVVIVVIGVLATITLVSFSGINTRALEASIQADVANIANVIKLHYTDQGSYPTSIGADGCLNPGGKYCSKVSGSNKILYISTAPYSTFKIVIYAGDSAYYYSDSVGVKKMMAVSGTTFTGNLPYTWGASWDENEIDMGAYLDSTFNLSPYGSTNITDAVLIWSYGSTYSNKSVESRTRWVEEQGVRVIESWPCNIYPSFTNGTGLVTSVSSHKGGSLTLHWDSSAGNAGGLNSFEERDMSTPKLFFVSS